MSANTNTVKKLSYVLVLESNFDFANALKDTLGDPQGYMPQTLRTTALFLSVLICIYNIYVYS